MPYFGEPVGRVKIQTTSKNSQRNETKRNETSNKRFIIQHAKLLCSWGRTSRVLIYGECVTEVCEAGRKLAREIQLTDWSTAGNLSNRSSGVQIPRHICTRFGRYLYSTRCSWIINRGYYTGARRYEFYFRVAKQFFTNERSEWAKYCLLYRHADDGHLPKISEDFPKLFRRPDERSRTFSKNFRNFPKMPEDFRRLPKIAEDFRGRPKKFRWYTNEFKYNLRDKLDINEIIDKLTSEIMEINHSGPGCSFYEFYEWYIFQ